MLAKRRSRCEWASNSNSQQQHLLPRSSSDAALPHSLAWRAHHSSSTCNGERISPTMPSLPSQHIQLDLPPSLKSSPSLPPTFILPPPLSRTLTNSSVTARDVSPQLPVLAESGRHDEVVIRW